MKGPDELVQMFDMKADVFTFINVKGESGSKQQQPCYFCYDHFLRVAEILVVNNLTSQHHCGMPLQGMLCFFHEAYMLSTPNN